MAQFTLADFKNLNFVDGNILNAYELNILKQFVNTAYQATLTQLAVNSIHVGPEPPTFEEYGEGFKNMLWIDTTDNADAGVTASTATIIQDLSNTVQEMNKQLEELQRQIALLIASGGGGPITAFNNCLELEDGSMFALEDGSLLKLEFASEPEEPDNPDTPPEDEMSWEGIAIALEDGTILTTEDDYILIFG